MNDDAQLLRRYAEHASESAFAELVARHIDLVYSAALRQLNGDTHQAQDVAQTVFADLAWTSAYLLNRLRLAIKRQPDIEPRLMLWDFVRYNFLALR